MGLFDNFFKNPFRGTSAFDGTPSLDPEDEINVDGQKVKIIEVGSSGTEIFSGYLQEEYLQQLRGDQAADIFDRMRRSDPKIRMVLNAMKNPIKAANWEVVSTESEPTRDGEIQRALIEHILFEDLGKSWDRFLHECLSKLDFGYSLFEVTYKAVVNDTKFGSYNGIKNLGFRSQRTIERWHLDRRTGKLISVYQQAYGDAQENVNIPAEYLLHFALDMEGDNFEGISVLRSCYGPWLRKNEYLKLMAAGIEKYAIPIPVLEIPEGKEDSAQYNRALQALQKYVSHRCNYLTVPAGWKLTLTSNNFDAEKIRSAIDKENMEIVNAALANFLELGQSGSGSYALSFDLSDFFLGGLEFVAKGICETINNQLIPKLIKLNFPDGVQRCELKVSGISDKAGADLAEVVSRLTRAQVLTPDDRLEDSLRKRFKLPERDESTQREVQAKGDPLNFSEGKEPGKSMRLATSEGNPTKKEKGVSKLIEREADNLQSLYDERLTQIQNEMLDRVEKHFRSSTNASKFKLPDLKSVPGIAQYKRELRELLAKIYNDSIAKVKKENTAFSNRKLAEMENNIRCAEVDKLSPNAKRRINADRNSTVETQIEDLAKAISLQYGMSVESTEDPRVIRQDIKEASDKKMQDFQNAGAVIAAAKTVNDARRDFFGTFTEEIVSFTWINDSPVADICNHLAGRTLPADHPDVERFWPPLHHNCKTYVVANTTTTKDNPETQNGFKPNKKELNSITLAEKVNTRPPESAINNAKKVLKWRDEHGDEVKGMTRVGWTRANQIASGESLSRETIGRIAAFARHEKNSKIDEKFKNEPWKDAGHVAWLGWGGTSGINWAKDKMKEIDESKA